MSTYDIREVTLEVSDIQIDGAPVDPVIYVPHEIVDENDQRCVMFLWRTGLVDIIALPGYGPLTHWKAAEIVSRDGQIAAVFLLPERDRTQWSWDLEEQFEKEVDLVARVLSYHGGEEPHYLVWRSGRNEGKEESIVPVFPLI